MAGLYIGSTTGYSGKNLIALGLGLKFKKDGLSLGYMKPVGAQAKQVGGKWGDEDAAVIQEVLGLDEDPSLVTPILVTQDFIQKTFATGYCVDNLTPIKQAYEKLSQDKDVMLVAGSGSFLHSGKYCCLDGITVAQSLGAKVLIIDRFHNELNYDYLLSIRETLGDQMIGAVLNDVPAYYMDELERVLIPFLETRGVKILGVIPHDSLMSAITIGRLAERLGGKIISAPHKAERVVESFLIGTMQVENFITHFRRHPKAAVIVGGDRSDLQLVAMEGNCACLILTGNLYPNDIILARAEAAEVPIMVVRDDTYSIAKRMDNLLERHKLRDVVKFQHGSQLVTSHLNIAAIREALGLK